MLPATLLVPFGGSWLSGRGLPRPAAALSSPCWGLALFVGALFALAGSLVASGIPEVAESARGGPSSGLRSLLHAGQS